MNSLRTAVKSLREQLRCLKVDYEEMEGGCAQDRAARLVVEEQLRKEHGDAVSLKQELDRVRALLEANQTRVVKTPVRTERGVDNGVLSALEQRLKEEKKTTEALREKTKGLEGKVRMKTEELKETEQRKEAELKRWEEERTRLYSEIDRWRQRSTEAQKTLEGNEGKAKRESKAIEDKLRRLSKSATEKSKRALAEKERELKKLAEEAEALRSTSDKLKELEKEHGKERRKSVAALSKADQLGLEMEKMRALLEQVRLGVKRRR
jgi:chromosome segregation ATPase